MKLSEILEYLDSEIPFALQEEYDNSGLILGEPDTEITGIMICLDLTDEVLNEASRCNCNLVISHHPLIFTPLKKLTGKDMVGKLVLRAAREGFALIACHTNLDNHLHGVNAVLCEKLGIINPSILRPLDEKLRKLAVFCPVSHADKVRTALFDAGAGHIGNYDSCSYNVTGQGSYRPLDGSSPFIGSPNELHFEEEIRIEVIYPLYLEKNILKAMLSAHPYEEVAYDIFPLKNTFKEAGAGMIGELKAPEEPKKFLEWVRETLALGCIRHSQLPGHPIRKVAICGGSGSFLIRDAINAGADLFLTGDIKYHDFFIPENRIILADIGHYESEQFTKELIFNLIKKKFPTFALQIYKLDGNPVKYL